MAIVSCPECGKKLKIADTSIGKKVKGPCGHIFVAAAAESAAPLKAAPPAPATEKVFVSCGECGAKLKVATTSLGKKMKCPKCAAAFVAKIEESPKAKPKAAVGDEDMDDFLAFAQADAAKESSGRMDNDDDDDFQDDDLPKPRAKPGKAAPARARDEDDDDAKPAYPSRTLANIVVILLLLIFAGGVGAVFAGIDLANMLGVPKTTATAKAKTPPKGAPTLAKKSSDTEKDAKTSLPELSLPIDAGKSGTKDDAKTAEVKSPPKKGENKLEGTWKVESAEANGKSVREGAGERFTFAGGKVIGSDPEQPPSYTFDDAKEPKWLTVMDRKSPVKGIYKIEGDKLYWCFPMRGPGNKDAPRPTAFDSKQRMLLVLRRAGADEAKAPAPPPPSPIGNRPGDTNLKVIALALQNSHDSFGKYPAAIYDPAGKPLLSWRVAILPFIEQGELYQKFDLTKPWDDPHNKKLIAEMPIFFVVPGTDGKTGKTHYRALMGPGTVFELRKNKDGKPDPRTIPSITDGTSNVIMVVEAKDPVEWTRPDDLPYDPKGPLPKFGVSPAGFNAAFADGSVRWIPATVTEAVLRPYLTCDNGMPRGPLADKGP